MDHSAVIGKVAAIQDYDYWSDQNKDTELQLFNYEYLTFEKRISFPRFVVGENSFDSHGKFVFYSNSGDKLMVILQADGSSGLLYDHGVIIY